MHIEKISAASKNNQIELHKVYMYYILHVNLNTFFVDFLDDLLKIER